VSYANCPRCRLSIVVRANALMPRHCPRCIGRARVLAPMFASPLPMRLLSADGADGADGAEGAEGAEGAAAEQRAEPRPSPWRSRDGAPAMGPRFPARDGENALSETRPNRSVANRG